MEESGLIYFLWSDLVGITRTRGVPLRNINDHLETGLGWACAGQALTPFQNIVENTWGPMDEVRQIPDLTSRFMIPATNDSPPIHAVICNSQLGPEKEWDVCVRSFCRNAIKDFKAETGLDLKAAFELEFLLESPNFIPEQPFSFSAARIQHSFLSALEESLTIAGVKPQTLEPEYGIGQYEISIEPSDALRAADVAVISREVTREVARRHEIRASFSPKPTLEHVGNGSHIHFSLVDSKGSNLTSAGGGVLGLSEVAQKFCAGILFHMDALLSITAPSPISYNRLGPHNWSTGYNCIGLQNREAAIRVIPGISNDTLKADKAFHFEFRASDSTASPYLSIGALVRAGLEGIQNNLVLPKAVEVDPSEMSDEERSDAKIKPLPESLEVALKALETDMVVRSWLSKELYETYRNIKRWEIDNSKSTARDQLFSIYRKAY